MITSANFPAHLYFLALPQRYTIFSLPHDLAQHQGRHDSKGLNCSVPKHFLAQQLFDTISQCIFSVTAAMKLAGVCFHSITYWFSAVHLPTTFCLNGSVTLQIELFLLEHHCDSPCISNNSPNRLLPVTQLPSHKTPWNGTQFDLWLFGKKDSGDNGKFSVRSEKAKKPDDSKDKDGAKHDEKAPK